MKLIPLNNVLGFLETRIQLASGLSVYDESYILAKNMLIEIKDEIQKLSKDIDNETEKIMVEDKSLEYLNNYFSTNY